MTKQICFLHAGTGKTGSSAIQYAFTKRRDVLRRHGYIYPDASNNFDAVLSGKPTAGNAKRINRLLRDGATSEAIEIVKKYAKPDSHLILSCEGLSNPKHEHLEEFASALRTLGYETRCLVFFRPQLELAISSYLQQAKADKLKQDWSLEDYVHKNFAADRLETFWNWHARAQNLRQIFGTVRVEWYPAVRRRGPTAIAQVAFDWLGAAALNSHTEDNALTVLNPTPGQEALSILRSANVQGLGGRAFADEFLKQAHAQNLLGAKVTLPRSTSQKIYEATLSSNIRLLKEYCPDLNPDAELTRPSFEESKPDPKVVDALQGLARKVLAKAEPGLSASQITTVFNENGSATEQATQQSPSRVRAASPPPGARGRRCIVHIGMHKTGSTSIQKSLNGFENGNFFYADLGGQGNHSLAIYSLFSKHAANHHLHRSAQRDAAAIEAYNRGIEADLERSIANAGSRTLLISGEDISALPRDALEKFRDYLKQHFDQISVVAYVRPPAGFMASSFQQRIKGGVIKELNAANTYRNYQNSFSKFDQVFGRENVELWKFDPKTFPGNCAVQDFSDRLGINFPKHKIVRLNESLSKEAVSLLYAYRKFTRGDDTRRMRGGEAMEFGKFIEGSKFRFSPDLVRPILQTNRADVAWMEERLGSSLAEDLGHHQAGDIRTEFDLLDFEPSSVAKLAAAVDKAYSPEILKNPAEVAELVGAWVERRRKRLPARLGRWFNRSDIDPVAEPARAPRQPRLAQILRRVRRREQENTIQPAATPVVVATGPGRSPYEGLPKTNYWRSGVAEVEPHTIEGLYVKKFAIDRTTKVATAGSCFAQHIGRRLKQRGFDVLDFEPPPASLSTASATKFGYNIYSARYGNIYLCRQLLQLAQEAFNRRSPAEVVWAKDGRFFDALRPGVEPEGFDTKEELLHHRLNHLQAVRKLLSEAELFIFTFGLTEGWISRLDGTAYPTAPGTIAGQFDPANYQFKNFTYSEVLSDFLEFRELMRSVNPRIRFLLTVSPVPLTATASPNHVLVASTYSKAVLRGVAGELTEKFEDVDYFPSFEVIASHFSKGAFFDSNLRTVTAEGVDTVMRIFFAAHDPNGRVSALQNVEDDARAKARERRQARRLNQKATRTEEEVCEEAMLEAFNR